MRYLFLLINVLRSVKTASVLTGLLFLVMLYGGFAISNNSAYRGINQGPLLEWLTETPLSITWWLWVSMFIVGLVVLNTVVCTAESILRLAKRQGLLLKISSQIIHLGFCLIMFGHLMSSIGSYHLFYLLAEGQAIRLGTDHEVRFLNLRYSTKKGFITEAKALIRLIEGERRRDLYLSPNRPVFIGGVGIYLKDFRVFPQERVLLEVSKEPGAYWALAGAVFFTVGTIMLLLLRVKYSQKV